MNNFRVVFYGLAVAAAVCVGDARVFGGEGGSRTGKQFPVGIELTQKPTSKRFATASPSVEFLRKVGGLACKNKFTLLAAAASSLIVPQEEDALAALVDSVGVSVDYYNLGFEKRPVGQSQSSSREAPLFGFKRDDIAVQFGVFGISFGVNYFVRKTGKYLNSNGYSVKSCLGDSAVVKVSTDVVMHPQMLTFLFWTTVNWLGGK